jgi:hypothetical protein
VRGSGSSAGVRGLLDPAQLCGKEFVAFKAANPQLQIDIDVRNGKHPFVVGHYAADRLVSLFVVIYVETKSHASSFA